MNNNNNGLRRSRRFARPTLTVAAAALLAACQSVGPSASEPTPAPVVVPAVTAPLLEPIVLPQLTYRDPVVEPDLLVRLRSGYAFDLSTNDAAVQRERAWYARNQNYLDRVFKRGDLYLFHIVAALEERD